MARGDLGSKACSSASSPLSDAADGLAFLLVRSFDVRFEDGSGVGVSAHGHEI